MRKIYQTILKQFFQTHVMHTRVGLALTQAEMADRLFMDERSYSNLDCGKTCCSAVTLALYLIYICEDAPHFLEELHRAFEDGTNRAA